MKEGGRRDASGTVGSYAIMVMCVLYTSLYCPGLVGPWLSMPDKQSESTPKDQEYSQPQMSVGGCN